MKEGEALELKSRVQSLREDNERFDRRVKELNEEVFSWKARYEELYKKQPNLIELDKRIDALGSVGLGLLASSLVLLVQQVIDHAFVAVRQL